MQAADADPAAPLPQAHCWEGCISVLRIGCCCLVATAVHPEAQPHVSTPCSPVSRPRWDAGTELVGLTSEPDGRTAGKAVMQRTASLVIGGAPLRQQIMRSSSSPPEHKSWKAVRDDVIGLVRALCGDKACKRDQRVHAP